MKRFFDIFFSLMLLIVTFVPLLVISLVVKIADGGRIFYVSNRVGIDNEIFKMPKFRTMREGTPVVATHLLQSGKSHLTAVGSFLRVTSFDELPQLWSVLVGEMSFVGPRPALYNQEDLIALRTDSLIHLLKPGITGWAQVNGRDELDIATKVKFDLYYLENQSILLDVKILFLTVFKVFSSANVSH